ncbi:MAG: hypothetical protein OHK0029_37980 [Armatimonadaceae bacterium]
MAGRLCSDFEIDAALSPPVLAAPSFIRAALSPSPEPVAPEPKRSSDFVDALTRPTRDTRSLTRRAIPFVLVLMLLLLFVSGVVVFQTALGLSWVDAIYFTTTVVTTVGFGDINLYRESENVKMFGVVLMFSGVLLIAAISSLLTNFFLSGAVLQLRAEQLAARSRDHIILCGLGSVGAEIAEELIAERHKVVLLDMAPADPHRRSLLSRVPMITGDATDANTLRRAGIDRARAIISAVSNDLVNLEIGFVAQTLVQERRPNRPLRIVLRCFDPDLAKRIHDRSQAYTLLSSAEIAAPIFVAQALNEETTSPLPTYRIRSRKP